MPIRKFTYPIYGGSATSHALASTDAARERSYSNDQLSHHTVPAVLSWQYFFCKIHRTNPTRECNF